MVELPPHPNIVHMYGVSIDGPELVLILEYCDGGSLDKALFSRGRRIADEHKIRVVRGIAAGVYHLHKHNIVHRDLAARNILLTSRGDPKISDFGMSRILEKEEHGKTKSNIGPVFWMAPESIEKQVYSKKSDVWTFGIVGMSTFYCCLRRHLFELSIVDLFILFPSCVCGHCYYVIFKMFLFCVWSVRNCSTE
jgi:serine/threonine protein kinase